MKICKLKLKNLNSFRGEIELDFEARPLNDASLVAITGPTGSGKTTLLDAICVALYGRTPRLSGTGSQNPNHLISHGEKEGFAEVLFMANSTRYLATWSIRQKGAPKVQLFYADDGKLISDKLSTRGKSLGSSQNTVSEEVASILGLDFDAFRRSVMLAQGEFAAFLKASNEDRRTILEATAGISIYDILKQALNDKVNAVAAAYAEVIKKIEGLPEVSPEQVAAAKKELSRLQKDAKRLGAEIQRIQKEKTRETKRTEDFETLQSSAKRQKELLDEQPEIDALQTEQKNAARAERIRSEKQMFDTATSELENANEAFHVATTEKTEAEEQVKTDQADFDEKEDMYQTASAERYQKMEIYEEAKSDVQQAANRFAEAEERDPQLVDLGNQVNTLKDKLANKQVEQTQLQERIDEAKIFLDVNHLPANSPQRLTDATALLAELTAYQRQLETASARKTQCEQKVSSLKQKIKKLSNVHAGFLAKKTDAETTLEDATTDLNKLLTTGTRVEWAARTRQTAKAQPIAQKYEATQNNLTGFENQLNALNDTTATLDAELEQIAANLANQTEVCREAAEVVQRCEIEKESAKWANLVNQLRQHLHTGKPCRVCGATEHPYADVVEDENEDLLQNAETAVANAETDAQAAEDRLLALKMKQIQTEQNKQNTTDQIEACSTEIAGLNDEAKEFLAEWQAIYPDVDVSSKWASEQFTKANAAVTAIGDAEKVHTQVSHAYQTLSQQLENSENNIANEKKSLGETKKQLQEVSNDVEDLEADIKSTETRFWELLPDAFQGVTPKEAKDLFEDKIKAVETHEDECRSAETQLQVLNIDIKADQRELEGVREDHQALQADIDKYRREGKAFLDAVREKTGGLTTEDEIDTAIKNLEAVLQKKENARDDAEQQLQNSRNLLTQKQTTHGHCKEQYEESAEKLEMARDAYFNKLEKEGFNSPEAHDNAFRDDDQIQDLTDQITAHENEMQQLALEITELQTRFKETPYYSDALKQIETQLEEIETQFQEAQQEIGAQQQKIDDLKDALEEREALGDELGAAQQELERWQGLQETIPANALRDFALEIMFKQMGSLANEQLKYLTSERYQLKVESIGNLTVIDRWNANEERPVQTLSGGESFLTSLALAIALSELSSGRAQLNSLFLDEGFGTLDSETLDTAIAALEGLQMQGRNIYLISHIQELTRRLPVKIQVNKKGNGSSSVKIQG